MSENTPTTGRTVISDKTRVAMPLIAMITGIIAICGAAGGTVLIYDKITFSVQTLTADKETMRAEFKASMESLKQDVRDLQAVVMGNHYLDNPIIRGRPVTRTIPPPPETTGP